MAEVTRRSEVSALDIEEVRAEGMDVFIGALGYERRAIHAHQQLSTNARTHLILAFPSRKVGSYDTNREYFEGKGVELVTVGDEWVYDAVDEVLRTSAPLDVITVDISSMSRVRLAAIVECVVDIAERIPGTIRLQFVYSLAEFSQPPAPLAPIAICEPVSARFAGVVQDPELPTVVVIGVGYEDQRGLGVVEYLEANDAWVFLPFGFHKRFDEAVLGANRQLLIDFTDHVVEYRPDSPLPAFRRLESLVHSLRLGARVVLAPMGPKIFATLCLILGIMNSEDLSVWRISSGELEEPRDVQPSGEMIGLEWRIPGVAASDG